MSTYRPPSLEEGDALAAPPDSAASRLPGWAQGLALAACATLVLYPELLEQYAPRVWLRVAGFVGIGVLFILEKERHRRLTIATGSLLLASRWLHEWTESTWASVFGLLAAAGALVALFLSVRAKASGRKVRVLNAETPGAAALVQSLDDGSRFRARSADSLHPLREGEEGTISRMTGFQTARVERSRS